MRERLKGFARRHFAWRYAPIYLYCAILLYSVLGSLSVFGSWMFDVNYVDGGAGWARRWFWTQLGVIPFAVYLFLAKALRLRWSLLLGTLCAALSLIPGVFYMILESGSASAYLDSHALMSVHFTIEIFALTVFVMADISVRKLIDRRRERKGL